MHELRKFITETVQAELMELAAGPSNADSRGLALLITDDAGEKQAILYDPAMIRQSFRMEKNYPIITGFRSPVVGTIRIKQNCGAWMVSSVVAERGFGPFMYDVAFSLVGDKGLMPDRSLVSPHARKIWKFITDKRTDEFSIKPVPANCKFIDKNKLGKEPYLDFIYAMKTPIQGLDGLKARNDQFIESLSSEINYNAKKLIALMATHMFTNKMTSLDEAAVPLDHAVNQGLALYSTKVSGVLTIMLYDPKLASTEQMVVGMIEITKVPGCGAWRVVTSVATRGYGPLLYDIAFSVAGDSGLMSGRAKVSDAAKRIWKFLATNRADEFEKIPLKPSCNFKEDDPTKILNHKFVMKNRLSLSGFEKNHSTFISSLDPSAAEEFVTKLEDQANEFFNKRYFGPSGG
jgi:hypothetical protein